ncbi:MAG: hypothetical protein KUG77_27525 [Nannocystaceae bacterium]|nr:hypothetical protein [Nannocystaceae bacterium]
MKHRENVLQRFPKYYVFVSRREGPPDGPWHVVGTGMRKTWMDGVWKELRAAQGLGEDLAVALGGDAFPQFEPPSWEQLNTFRTNAQIEGGGICIPDPAG